MLDNAGILQRGLCTPACWYSVPADEQVKLGRESCLSAWACLLGTMLLTIRISVSRGLQMNMHLSTSGIMLHNI